MVDRGEAELLAVMTSTGQPAAIGAISAANHWYGHDDVQLGAYKGPLATDKMCTICRGPYIDDLVANFSGPIKDYSQVLEAQVLYRKVLAAQPDGSVVIAAHGFLVNLQALLNSTADEYSDLSGVELVRKKVQKIAIMGGHYPRSFPVGAHHSTECKLSGIQTTCSSVILHWLSVPQHCCIGNFGGGCVGPGACGGCGTCRWSSFSSAYVTEHWPSSVPMVFSGFELGVRILTGARLLNGEACPASVPANPCRKDTSNLTVVVSSKFYRPFSDRLLVVQGRRLQTFRRPRRARGERVGTASPACSLSVARLTLRRWSQAATSSTPRMGRMFGARTLRACGRRT